MRPLGARVAHLRQALRAERLGSHGRCARGRQRAHSHRHWRRANDGVSANSEANSAYSTSSEGENLPVVTIHSTGDISRGKTGSFVLEMKPALAFSAMYVNFKVSGTAVAGVDYVAFASPAYIGQSGYATILVKTLRDPRASSSGKAYSVVVTLQPGAGYSLGSVTGGARSATIWIKPGAAASDW